MDREENTASNTSPIVARERSLALPLLLFNANKAFA
jgi:hypothetical protein